MFWFRTLIFSRQDTGLPSDCRHTGGALECARAHHFDPVPPNMNLAISSDSGTAPWVLSISPPAGLLLVAAGLEHHDHAAQQRFAHDLGVGVERQVDVDATIMRTTAW